MSKDVTKDKRLLAICDLSKFTWSIGEFLQFQLGTLMARIKHGVDKIDIVWLYNPEYPATAKALRKGKITKENSAIHLKELLSLGHVNPYLGTFEVMGLEKLEKFVECNSDRYVIDPPFEVIKQRKSQYRAAFGRTVDFYETRGFLPSLSCQPDVVKWACHFLNKNCDYPVVMQLRNSPFGGTKGNSNSPLNEWLGFFTECQKKFSNVKFIIVCGKEELEVDKHFEESARQLKNIIFSKKYGKHGEHSTTVEQDCALIQSSKICMGSSGMMAMAVFGKIPFLIFSPNYKGYGGKLNEANQIPYATPFQRLVWGFPVTKEIIMKAFKNLYDQLGQ